MKKNIFKVSIGIVILEVVLKIFGFIKQAVIANYYGATEMSDIYFIVEGFITSVSAIVVKSLPVAVIGVYTSVRIRKGRDAGNRVISEVSTVLIIISGIVILALNIAAPFFAKMIAPTYTAGKSQILINYLRIASAIILFSFVELIFTTILNSHEQYFITKLRSFFYSICVIIVCISFSKTLGIKALFLAEYLSYILYIILVAFFSNKYEHIRPVNPKGSSYIKEIVRLMLPVILGNSIAEINYMIDRSISSTIAEGAVSSLYYGQIMDQFVTVVIIGSITSVVFAHFSVLIAEGNEQRVKQVLEQGLSILTIVLIPTSILLIFNARDVIEIVYFRGAFTYDKVLMSALVLQGYAFRYVFMAVRDILTQTLYAYHDTTRPLIVSVATVVVNLIVSISMYRIIGIIAIPLGTSISSIVGMLLNMHNIKSKLSFSFAFVKRIFAKSIPAIVIIIAALCLKTVISVCDLKLLNIASSALISYGVYFIYMYVYRESVVIQMADYVKSKLKIKRL